MAETANIGEIAAKLSTDIFKHFHWRCHPKRDDNFKCHDTTHVSEKEKPKTTHPGDAVFYYNDPYLGKTIYLHTDLKIYGKKSLTVTRLRDALKSLSMTIACATASSEWREKYSVDESESHEVRGLLFVHNHDNKYGESFYDAIEKVGTYSLPLPQNSIIHFLGPRDIQRLYNITNDIIRLKSEGLLPATQKHITFYYPDLVLCRRQGDVWEQPATIESLTGPFLIIRYKGAGTASSSGYVIYYNRKGDCPEEFEYFLDCLSRFQMLESGEHIRIRVTAEAASEDFKSKFETAKKKYVKAWGFEPGRQAIIDAIEIERITGITNTYNPGSIGWKK